MPRIISAIEDFFGSDIEDCVWAFCETVVFCLCLYGVTFFGFVIARF